MRIIHQFRIFSAIFTEYEGFEFGDGGGRVSAGGGGVVAAGVGGDGAVGVGGGGAAGVGGGEAPPPSSTTRRGPRVRGPWSPEPKNWGLIARGIPGRSGKSCRLRWCNQPDPCVKRKPFTGNFAAI
ncbi:hypothetical protein RND81_04G053900 [Saponaria officinalis]|uniref:Uncharacterized protein n=1 Tax=Saponaria officinalis TaxID=3572 RepID=A0AAW1LHC4_SAPOF